MFETDFDEPGDGLSRASMRKANAEARAIPEEPPPPPEPTFTTAELEEASAKAHAAGMKEGISKGRAEAEAKAESQIAAALAAINAGVPALTAKVSLDRKSILMEAAALGLAIVRKILPEFSRRGGLAEIEAVIDQCIADQRREPRLIARVPQDLLPGMEAKIASITAGKGFDGRIELVGDPGLSGASCRIEWADGELERHADAIWRQVAVALDRCLAAQGITPPDLAEPALEPAGSASPGQADEPPRSE